MSVGVCVFRCISYVVMCVCVQVYASTSDEYVRDGGGYPGAKPGAVYPGSFYMQGEQAPLLGLVALRSLRKWGGVRNGALANGDPGCSGCVEASGK